MAGKRQHYVPRLLQRGFLANVPNDAERTWLHRPGVAARLVGIGDVGTEDWFYSRRDTPGELTLDDVITAFENDLGRDVSTLRAAPPGMEIEAQRAAHITVHLVMRTAHLRRTIADGIHRIIGEVEALFTDPVRLGARLGFDSPMPTLPVAEVIRNLAQTLVPAGFPAAFSERLLAFLVCERGEELIGQAVGTLKPMFPTLLTTLVNQVRDSHNTIIAKPLDDHGWVAVLSTFQWSVEEKSDLILPDSVALAREAGGALTPLIFTDATDAEVVLLPVSQDRILIGRRNPNDVVDLSTFNKEAAANCQGFFIGARSFDAEALSAVIGTGPAEALAEAIADAVRDAEDARSSAADELSLARPRSFSQRDFSYRVTLHDFGDDLLAQEYGAIVQSVAGALSRYISLHDLDGITIAQDYNDALARIDRGDRTLPPVTSGALGYGIGVAKPISVMREGARKEHLVLAADIAAAWASKDPNQRAFSTHLLIKMLAEIAHASRYADAPAFTPDAMGRELHLAVAHAPCGYWSAKQAAFAALDQGQVYSDLVVDSLNYARSSIAEARTRMTDSSDVSEASLIALKCVSAVLNHAADWLGHRDGVPEGKSFAGVDLPLRLAPFGLDNWLALFGRDLARGYKEDGAIDLAVVTTLSRHVERLFWSLGVYCWPDGEQVRCVISDLPLAPHLLPKMDLTTFIASEEGDANQ